MFSVRPIGTASWGQHGPALAVFFAFTTAALASVVVWLVAPQFQRTNQQTSADQDIVFGMKLFVGTSAWVAAKGTLTADWLAYKNNTFSILCQPEKCVVASVNQIGPKQVGQIDGPTAYPVKHWTEGDEVVAEDNHLCQRITITVDRRTQTVLWVETSDQSDDTELQVLG